MVSGSPSVSISGGGSVPHTPTPAAQRWGQRLVGAMSGPKSREHLIDAAGVVVITGALLVYGILQERIMTIGFGPTLELFEHSIFLVLCNRLVTCLVAFACVAFTGSDVKPAAPLFSYCTVSLTNVVATSCQYEALKFVSFAIQTLAKSAKAFPVMIWGSVWGGKRYKPTEYLHAGAICFGCTVFVMGGNTASRVVAHSDSYTFYLFGGGLMLLYLAVDGLTSTWQDKMFTNYSMTIYDQVLYTTAFSTLLSFAGAVFANQLWPSLQFVLRNPDALTIIMALSVSSACVQLIISYTIKRYGALVFATIMTTRQFFSILLSSIVFWTPLRGQQWLGLLIVFGATYWKLAQGVLASSRLGRGGTSIKSSPPPASALVHAHGSGTSLATNTTTSTLAPLIRPLLHENSQNSDRLQV